MPTPPKVQVAHHSGGGRVGVDGVRSSVVRLQLHVSLNGVWLLCAAAFMTLEICSLHVS